jgi:hypothetical protein
MKKQLLLSLSILFSTITFAQKSMNQNKGQKESYINTKKNKEEKDADIETIEDKSAKQMKGFNEKKSSDLAKTIKNESLNNVDKNIKEEKKKKKSKKEKNY